MKILRLLTGKAWVEFLEVPLKGAGRQRLEKYQLERVPEEKKAPTAGAASGENEDGPLPPAAPAATAPDTASTAGVTVEDAWREAASVF